LTCHWFQRKRTLHLVFICKRFLSRLRAGQLKSYRVSTGFVHVNVIAVVKNVQYLAVAFHSSIHRGKR